jgi:putative ABC transport system permease protein
MLWNDLVKSSTISIKRNKTRSALTILGIVIGIASVILMLSIGKSAEGLILSQVADLGSDLLFVEASAGDPTQGPPNPFIEQSITLDDQKALEQTGMFMAVSAILASTDTISHEQETQFTSINGINEGYLDIFPADLLYGRFFSSSDIDGYARVTVLGKDIANDLFGQQDPTGMKVKIGSTAFRVIGVFDEQGTRFFQDLDTQISIPVTTMQHDLMGVDHVSYLVARVKNDIDLDYAKDEVRFVLRDEHDIDNPQRDLDLDDFYVSSQSDAEDIIGVVGSVLTLLLSSIAAISLVVGGIGIMNIMLVSVTERTREIGLRKAIGATRKEIMQQFLAEAVLLTLTGGIIGVLGGIIASTFIALVAKQFLSDWSLHIPINAIVLGVIVATVVGIAFGVYPAKRAANLDPIEALRYE